MVIEQGKNFRVEYENSKEEPSSACGGSYHATGFMRGYIGQYKLNLGLVTYRFNWRGFWRNVGISGLLIGNSHEFQDILLVDGYAIKGYEHRGKLFGGVVLDGKKFDIEAIPNSNGSLEKYVLIGDLKYKPVEKYEIPLVDLVNIATVAMLIDGSRLGKAREFIETHF